MEAAIMGIMQGHGLSSVEAKQRLEQYGPNDVAENKTGILKRFLAPLYSPMSLMLLGAAALSYFNSKTFDGSFILFLYVTNYAIQKWQECKADQAVAVLRDKLSFDVSVLRDGAWQHVNARELVPGDYVRLGLGAIIPADATVFVSNNLSTNESVLTGESLPKEKKVGDKIFSGSFVATGNLEADIAATGKNTSFGRTIFSIEQPTQQSILERDMGTITRFLTVTSIVAACILSFVLLMRGQSIRELLALDVSLIIAGVPVALPAVMTIILSIGAAGLTKRQIVVRRLSALQDLANVTMLLTDKTGTLTKNEIKVVNVVSYQEGRTTDDIVDLARHATSGTMDAIGIALEHKREEIHRPEEKVEILNLIPYDSDRKRTTALVQRKGEKLLISVGASQVIEAFGSFANPHMKERFDTDVAHAAREGYRVLAVAIKEGGGEESDMHIAGLLFLADPLDEHSKETVRFLKHNGIGVRMVTGDNLLIAQRVAQELALSGEVLSVKDARTFYKQEPLKGEERVAGFAEILPADKYELVRAFRSKYVVASTGDGINDLPPLRAANVGIAVSGAVSALRSMADIVLLGRGLGVIRDAIIESRKIFTRLYNYSTYRLSESFRVIITILVLGLLYGSYPLSALQIILLAFLNDLPIISLAFDRVKVAAKPSTLRVRERFVLSTLFGSVGVVNSLILFFVLFEILHVPLPIIQTIFFLKLTVSGHLLVFVAHTPERWYRYLPSREVIGATLTTQLIATALAVSGFLMPSPISLGTAAFVWAWAFFWMQVSEGMKDVQARLVKRMEAPVVHV